MDSDRDNDDDHMFQGIGSFELAQNNDVADAMLKRFGSVGGIGNRTNGSTKLVVSWDRHFLPCSHWTSQWQIPTTVCVWNFNIKAKHAEA